MLSEVYRNNNRPIRGRTLPERSRNENARVASIRVQIRRESRIDQHFAVVMRGGRVHEMEHTVTCPQREADV